MPRRNDRKERKYAQSNRKNMPPAEVILWTLVRRKQLGVSFRRQHPIAPFIADFACLKRKLIIEIDGETHIGHEDYDEKRTQYLRAKGWAVLRFTNDAVYDHPEGVVAQIETYLLGETYSPSGLRPPPP